MVTGLQAPSASAGGRPRVCVLERNDFGAWRERWARGVAAGALPYGLDALGDRFDLIHPDRAWPRPVRTLLTSAEYRTDRKVDQVLASVGALRSSDACLSIFEDFGLTYAALGRVLPRLPPLLLMTCWMTQRLLTFAHQQRDAFRRLVERAGSVTVFSANQVPVITNLLRVPESTIHVLDFGVVTDFFVPAPEAGVGRGYIASVGQDAGRDWPTFFAAAAAHPELRFKLAAWPNQMVGYRMPDNVEMLGGLPPDGYRSLLQHADFVVVASHPLPYPTGQSVLLESLACGRPVVASRSAAMRGYLDHDAVLTYEAGDPGDLAARIGELAADPDRRAAMGRTARRVATERFDSAQMWARVGDLLDELV